MKKVAVLVPCFKRPEYTRLCIAALEKTRGQINADFYLVDDGSKDGTEKILSMAMVSSTLIVNEETRGLRNVIIDFFELVRGKGYDYYAKMDNDCVVPDKWLDNLIDALDESGMDIVSPNVIPSNAAFVHGRGDDRIKPSDIVGGLWCMKASMVDGIDFERFRPNGIQGAFNILKQIIYEKEAKVAWVSDVTVGDIGHWSGAHPLHIKSEDHAVYSAEIGRPVSWTV